jgi:zinc/manganese transport system substrate-binding protein
VDFFDVSAAPTPKMVVVLVGPTPSIEGFTAIRTDDVDESQFGHLMELGVDRSETYAFARFPDRRMEFLCRGKTWCCCDGCVDGSPLTSHSLGTLSRGHLLIVIVLISTMLTLESFQKRRSMMATYPFRLKPVTRLVPVFAVAIGLVLAGCGTTNSNHASTLDVVAAESPWGAVASAVGGPFVSVDDLVAKPNVDPHEFTATAADAAAVAQASVVVDNGAGYDDFMNQLLSTDAPGPRTVITAANVLDATGPDVNPHLWYAIEKVPLMAHALAEAFSSHDPAHRSQYFANARAFDESLRPIDTTIATIRTQRFGAPVGETERVAGYLLDEAGLNIVTPISFALSVESGTSPSAAATAEMTNALAKHAIDALVYNVQTQSPLTQSVRSQAHQANVPVVGVSEVVEPLGASFVSWQQRQINELAQALGVSP